MGRWAANARHACFAVYKGQGPAVIAATNRTSNSHASVRFTSVDGCFGVYMKDVGMKETGTSGCC